MEGDREHAAAENRVSNLPLYLSAPDLEVKLEDFEDYAIDRLRVLKAISDGRGMKPEELEKLVTEQWEMHMKPSEVVKKDIISHFVLRLVYCRTEELRRWFISMETALFWYRFRSETPESQRAVMADFNLPYQTLTNAEYENVKDKLSQVTRSIGQSRSGADNIFYKVPVEEVPELVANNRVFIQNEHAYVNTSQVVSRVVTQFSTILSEAIVVTNSKWTSMIREQEKDHLTPIVESFISRFLGPAYTQPRDSPKSSIPLCMSHLFEKLEKDHHVKHEGKMPHGLFFKGVCLKMDEALALWRSEFSSKPCSPNDLFGCFLIGGVRQMSRDTIGDTDDHVLFEMVSERLREIYRQKGRGRRVRVLPPVGLPERSRWSRLIVPVLLTAGIGFSGMYLGSSFLPREFVKKTFDTLKEVSKSLIDDWRSDRSQPIITVFSSPTFSLYSTRG